MTFPVTIAIAAIIFWLYPPGPEVHVLFDINDPSRNGELISNGLTPLHHALGFALIATAAGFLPGAVLLTISFCKSTLPSTPTI